MRRRNAREMARGSARQVLCSSLINHIEMNIADPALCQAKTIPRRHSIRRRGLDKLITEDSDWVAGLPYKVHIKKAPSAVHQSLKRREGK